MRILELHMKHFGKFEEERMRFEPGINIIYGGNETGKTTMHAFIRAMFFGIGSSRGRGGRPDEYQLRRPWENGSYFAGAMKVESEGKVYRIERSFDKTDRDVRLICESDGQELPADTGLEELLGGVSEAVFLNTVFISQTGAATDEALAVQLREYMVNMQENSDASVNVPEALADLRKQRRELEQRREKERELTEEKIARKKLEQEYLQSLLREQPEEKALQDADASGSGAADREGKRRAVGTQDGRADRRDQSILQRHEKEGLSRESMRQEIRRFLIFLKAACAILTILGILCAFLEEAPLMKTMMAATGLLFLVILLLIRGFEKEHPGLISAAEVDEDEDEHEGSAEYPDHEEDAESNTKQLDREEESESGAEYLDDEEGSDSSAEYPDHEEESENRAVNPDNEAAKRERQIRLAERERIGHERKVMLENVNEELAQLYRDLDRTSALDEECEAIDLAILRIADLSAQVYRDGGSDFARRSSRILSELTEGRYTAISLDEKMQVRINTPDKLLNLSQVSYGTMEQIYLALRMAAGQMLGGEELPLVLDEPFAMYDDERMNSALRWMRSSGRQVLLFTCQTREQEAVRKLKKMS